MPEIEKKVSIGNVWSMLVTVGSILVAGAYLQSASAQAVKELQDHEARIRVLESDLAVRLTRMEEQLTSIQRALRTTP